MKKSQLILKFHFLEWHLIPVFLTNKEQVNDTTLVKVSQISFLFTSLKFARIFKTEPVKK